MNSLVEILIVAIGGGLGAVARFALDRALKSPGVGMSPLASLSAINILGSMALGLLLGMSYVFSGGASLSSHVHTASTSHVASNLVITWLIPFFGTGFCGGFTTFSTAVVEAIPPRLRVRADATPDAKPVPNSASRWSGIWQLVVMTAACVVAALLGYVGALFVFAP